MLESIIVIFIQFLLYFISLEILDKRLCLCVIAFLIVVYIFLNVSERSEKEGKENGNGL